MQIATALSVFCFLPHTQWRRGNIMVDTFTLRLPARINRIVDAAWDFLFAAIIALLAYCLMLGTEEAFTSGLTSMVLGVSIAPGRIALTRISRGLPSIAAERVRDSSAALAAA